jgi:ABC-type nitrate/sulfonate/bicarbonate transport system substrate-binding protein
MSKITSNATAVTRRTALGLAAGAAGLAAGLRPAAAAPKMRIGLATKTWWPSVICETAVQQKLFEKAGIDAELTVYRSGGEAFEAVAAGASDLTIGLAAQIATGRLRGVKTKFVSLGTDSNPGWRLLVKTSSPIQSVKDIAGKKVGITAAASLSDFLAIWLRSDAKIDFTSVPLGGGGLVPNLLSGNVDAAVVYSPLSFQVMQAGQARSLLNFATAVPPHLASGWATTDALIDSRKDDLRNTLKAIYASVAYMRAHRDEAIKIIAQVNSIPEPIAKEEYEETFLKLSTDGRFTMDQTNAALALARVGGFDKLAPAEEIVTTQFIPIPPMA